MKKKLAVILILFITSVFGLVTRFDGVFYANDEQAQQQDIVTYTSYDNKAHLNLQNVEKFTMFNNNLLYIKNNSLYCYNKSTNQNSLIEGFSNVSKLVSVNNYIAFLEDSSLVFLDNNYKVVPVLDNSEELTLQASHFSLKTDEIGYKLVLLLGNQLQVLELDNNLNFQSINDTTLYTEINASSITINENYIYIAHRDGANYILQINLSNLNLQNNINTTLLNTTNLVSAKLYDTNLFFAISNGKLTLNILEINNVATTPAVNVLKTINSSGILTPSFVKGDLSEITDLQIVGEEILILDSINLSLQSFNITFNNGVNLEEKEIVAASSSYSPGRFFSATDIATVSENKLLVADTKNNRLQIINNQEIKQVTHINDQETKIALHYPTSIRQDNQNNYVIYNKPIGQNNVLVANEEGELLNSISTYAFNDNIYNLGNLTNIAMSYDNEIYALDYSNNTILVSNNYETFNVILNAPFNIPLNAKSKIATTINKQLIVLHDNEIYLLNQAGQILDSYEITAKNLTVDYLNNVFMLQDNGITKLQIKETKFNFVALKENDDINFNQITLISVVNGNGKLFLYSEENEQIITLENSDFSDGLLNFEHPKNVFNNTPLNSEAELATTLTSVLIYEFPYYTGNNYELTQNELLFVIDNNVYENFSFVLFNKSNVLTQGYVPKEVLKLSEIAPPDSNKNLITVNTTVTIFKFPALLNTSINSALPIATIPINTQLQPVSEAFLSLDNCYYYAVLVNDTIGYVNYADVIYDEENLSTLKPLNQKTFNLSGKTKVYAENNLDSEILCELNNFSGIYVEIINEQEKFTKIIFRNSGNAEVSGYILTEDIWKGAESEKSLTSLILLLSGLTLLVIAYIIYVKIKKSKELQL